MEQGEKLIALIEKKARTLADEENTTLCSPSAVLLAYEAACFWDNKGMLPRHLYTRLSVSVMMKILDSVLIGF